MTNKKTLDTGWKRQKNAVAGIIYAIRRRVICEGIGETHPPEPGRYEDVEIEMTAWSSAQGSWSWSVRATAVGAPAWEYKFLESKRPHASKASAKREVIQVGHGLAKLIAGHTAHDSDPPGRKVVWPERERSKWTRLDALTKPLDEDFRERITRANKPAKRPRRMQWPTRSAAVGQALVRHIVDAIERTHKVRRIKGSTSDYIGLDNVRVDVTDEARRENVVDVIDKMEREEPERNLIHKWISLAFMIGAEQGMRIAQEKENLWSAALKNPEVVSAFRRKFEREQVPMSVPPDQASAFERVVALYRTKLASRMLLGSAIEQKTVHVAAHARDTYGCDAYAWEKAEGELIAESMPGANGNN